MAARLVSCLMLISAGCFAAEEANALLERIHLAVASQLSRSSNYTCVETLTREYFRPGDDPPPGCHARLPGEALHEIAHDRLRLDIAVSEGSEIYAWHGENNFSASSIQELVSNGPISSGAFIGFLHNVFFIPGVQFRYQGETVNGDERAYSFAYTVPLASSRYHLQSGKGLQLVPFRGSFSVRTADLQLLTFDATVDEIPAGSAICSTQTHVVYQSIQISGTKALVPASFTLRIGDHTPIETTSNGVYSQCREFRGESTVHFDLDTSATASASPDSLPTQQLPPGMTLRVGLASAVSDQDSFTGDPVEGVLLDPAIVPGTRQVLPKGSPVKGVITQLEYRSEPEKHFFVRIEWERVIANRSAFVFRSRHEPNGEEPRKLFFVYGSPLPAYVTEELQNGTVVLPGRHLRLDRHFSGIWATIGPEKQTVKPTS